MVETPLISVVMPVYNGVGLLERAVESVCRQTFEKWELLVTDDGSTDDSAEVVEQIAAQEPRVRLFRLPENSGIGSGRNLALEHARGEMICYLDCDDEFQPLHLANIAALRHRGDVLVFCYDIISPPAETSDRWIYTWNPAVSRDRLFCGNIATPLGVVHHRNWADKIGGFNSLLWNEEDVDYWRRLAERVRNSFTFR